MTGRCSEGVVYLDDLLDVSWFAVTCSFLSEALTVACNVPLLQYYLLQIQYYISKTYICVTHYPRSPRCFVPPRISLFHHQILLGLNLTTFFCLITHYVICSLGRPTFNFIVSFLSAPVSIYPHPFIVSFVLVPSCDVSSSFPSVILSGLHIFIAYLSHRHDLINVDTFRKDLLDFIFLGFIHFYFHHSSQI